MLPARGRVVMVSGASRGIGRAVAQKLAADGFTLSLGVRRPSGMIDALALDPEEHLAHAWDALDPAASQAWVAATVERFGRIDGLVNNAGILRPLDFETGDESVLDELWAVNVKAPFRLIRLAMPHLKAAGHGRIVTVASTDGKRARAGVSVAYTMTKHAAVALTHAARLAGYGAGVRATALCPGATDTDLIAGIPGVTPAAQRLKPETVAELVSLLLRLPDQASVAELVVNTRLESTI